MSTTTTPTLFAKLRAWAAAELSAVEQAALHLLGVAALAETSVKADIAASPLAQTAIAVAEAHGVPVAELGADAEAVIAEGQKLASELASSPAAPVAAPPAAA